MSLYKSDTSGTYIHISEFEKYRQAYTLKNLEKSVEIRAGNLWKAKKMPDNILHYSKHTVDYIQVPPGIRGYIDYMPIAYNHVHHPVKKAYQLHGSGNEVDQVSAVNSLLSKPVGLMHADTGTGKSVMICEIITKLNTSTLIIVKDKTLLTQMVSQIEKLLGIIPTIISGDVISKKKQSLMYSGITVACISSIHKIPNDQYGCILYDECHTYLHAEPRRKFVFNRSAQYIYGFTGTPIINNVDQSIFKLYFGPTTRLKGHTSPIDYAQVYSELEVYIDDPRKEWATLVETMVTSEKRNNLIVSTVKKHLKGRKGLIFTERVSHAKLLQSMIQSTGIKCELLIGEVSKDERERIRQEVINYSGECIIVGSTDLIGTGFDIAELSFGILTTATRFKGDLQQYVGRLLRAHPTKPRGLFIDIVDCLSPLLANQAKSRLQAVKKEIPNAKILSGLF